MPVRIVAWNGILRTPQGVFKWSQSTAFADTSSVAQGHKPTQTRSGRLADGSGHWDLTTGRVRPTANQAVTRRGAREDSIMLLLVGAPFTGKAKSWRGWALLWWKPRRKLTVSKVGWGPEMLTQCLLPEVSEWQQNSVGTCSPVFGVKSCNIHPALARVFISTQVVLLKWGS